MGANEPRCDLCGFRFARGVPYQVRCNGCRSAFAAGVMAGRNEILTEMVEAMTKCRDEIERLLGKVK